MFDLKTLPINGRFYRHNKYDDVTAYVIDADTDTTWNAQTIGTGQQTRTTAPIEDSTADFVTAFTLIED